MTMERVMQKAPRRLQKVVSEKQEVVKDIGKQNFQARNVSSITCIHQELQRLGEQNKRDIHKKLSTLIAQTEYPREPQGFTVSAGTGLTSVLFEVEYSGINRWWLFGWREAKVAKLKISIHHGVKVESSEFELQVDGKRDNSRAIAEFMKGVVNRAYLISEALIVDNPLYKIDDDNFESELILRVADVLADPNVAAIYLHLEGLDALQKRYRNDLNDIAAKARDRAEEQAIRVKELAEAVNEKWKTFEEDLLGVAKSREELLQVHYDSLLKELQDKAKKKAEAEEKFALAEVNKKKKAVEREVNTLKRELKKLEKQKGDVTKSTRELLVKFDRWFPNYDYGRNRKEDPEDVTPFLRGECARKLGQVEADDPSLSIAGVISLMEFFVKNIRRSAGQKFNGLDLREMVDAACWMLKSVDYPDIKWTLDRLGRGYDRKKVSSIRRAVEGLVSQKHEDKAS